MAIFGEPAASGASTPTARAPDRGDGLHWAGMSSSRISRHHARQACPTRTQSSVQLRSPPDQRSSPAGAQRPDLHKSAGASSMRTAMFANHTFTAGGDGSRLDQPCRAPMSNFEPSEGMRRKCRGKSCPPVSTDPIAFRHLEGSEEAARPLRRMGYRAPSATNTWDLSRTHGPPDTEGHQCSSARQRDFHTNGGAARTVAGHEDLMPASTRRHIGADLPASADLQRMNDKRELLLSERGASKAHNPHLASSPEMKLILTFDENPLAADRRATPRSQRVYSTPSRFQRPRTAPAGGDGGRGSLPCFSARSNSSTGSTSNGLWSDVGRTCTAHQLRQALKR